MAKNKIAFEKDEKKSIIIAIIVSIVVCLAIMLAFVAIGRHRKGNVDSVSAATETEQTTNVTEGNAIVTNQEELNAALSDETALVILLETDETQTIVIPAGDYSGRTLMVNAPYTEITNYGIFDSVTINQIASNTWTESASGNALIVDAQSCHIVVPSGITVSSIESIQAGSTLAVELQGTLSVLALEAESSIVSVQVDGELPRMMIYSATNLTLTGSSPLATSVELASGSDGTVLTSSIPVNVSASAQANLEFKEGAEGSRLTIANASSAITLTNNTKETITVVKADGEETEVGVADTFECVAENNAATENGGDSTENSSPGSENGSQSSGSGNGGSGNSSSGSSSGRSSAGGGYTQSEVDSMINAAVANANAQAQSKIDEAVSGMISQDDAQKLVDQAVEDAKADVEKEKEKAVQEAVENVLAKPMIVEFVDEATLCAGVQGSLPKVSKLALPKEVYGCTGSGEIYTLTVKKWKNTDNYSQSVTAGAYRFTAVLKASTDCYVASGVEAHVTVYVRSASNDYFITYSDAEYQKSINVTEYRAADYSNVQQTYPEAYYVIKNVSDSLVIHTALDFYYYDSKGTLVESSHWNGIYIQPGKSWVAYRTKPCVEYAYYVVEVNNYTSRNTKVEGFAKVQFTDTFALEVYKASDKNISECTVMVLYLAADGKTAYGTESFSTGSTKCTTSINDISQTAPLTVNLHVPDGADINHSVIVWKGGYE